MILSFDTSLPVLSVAILEDDLALGSLIVEGAGSRNEKLLPAVDWLLAEVGRTLESVDRIVVTRGPGSFTGIRIGLATAQGLSFSRGTELTAMSTHESVTPPGPGRVIVVSEAGRGEVYRTVLENGLAIGAPLLVPRVAAERDAAECDLFIDVDSICRDRNVALMAARRARLHRDEVDPGRYSDFTPIYVRASAAEEKRRTSE
jgi:tRNA threonylcarbamoyl adenosine modification protein YeaZ